MLSVAVRRVLFVVVRCWLLVVIVGCVWMAVGCRLSLFASCSRQLIDVRWLLVTVVWYYLLLFVVCRCVLLRGWTLLFVGCCS